MVFSSPVFLFYFLPFVWLIYRLLQSHQSLQNAWLFICSLLFYTWGEKQFMLLVLISILLNYGIGMQLAGSALQRTRRLWLITGVVLNLSFLLYFKYANFIFSLLNGHLPASPVHLPLGISFFTFHGLTYITDIYRQEARHSRSPLNVGLYILFFPQLIAGPIVRYRTMDQQLIHRTPQTQRLYDGIRRFIIGLAKKILIANTAGHIADAIYSLPDTDLSTTLTWTAALSYMLQIYFDFSGYSDMAIGLAKLFGFEFPENFNFPYAASSIQDFWRRWHISLSTFFRDYVYIPLGGNRISKGRTYFNLILVFFLTGLWHGASWNFIIWGLYHGIFLLLERGGLARLLERLPAWLRVAYTWLVVLCGWILFRIETLPRALQLLCKLVVPATSSTSSVYSASYFVHADQLGWLLCGLLFSFPVHRFATNFLPVSTDILWKKLLMDGFYLFLFALSLSYLAATTFNPFIYFRF